MVIRPSNHWVKPPHLDKPKFAVREFFLENFFSCKIDYHMLTKFYLTLRLCPSLARKSKNKGLLRVNPEQPPALRAESRRVDLF
jgi:hypothetical protein